jgi:hypothetical protein
MDAAEHSLRVMSEAFPLASREHRVLSQWLPVCEFSAESQMSCRWDRYITLRQQKLWSCGWRGPARDVVATHQTIYRAGRSQVAVSLFPEPLRGNYSGRYCSLWRPVYLRNKLHVNTSQLTTGPSCFDSTYKLYVRFYSDRRYTILINFSTNAVFWKYIYTEW